MRTRRFALASALAACVSAVVFAHPAHADALSFGPMDIHSAFYVSKSQNENQIHYAIRLDSACRPVGKAPVFAYWRRMKSGSRVDAPLEGMGTRFYGASDEQSVSRGAEGGHVRMYVKALKRAPVDISITKDGARCVATATTQIAKAPALLDHAYLQLGRFGLTVKYVELFGKRRDGQKVSEKYED